MRHIMWRVWYLWEPLIYARSRSCWQSLCILLNSGFFAPRLLWSGLEFQSMNHWNLNFALLMYANPGHWGRRRIVWFQLGLVGICGAGRSNLPGNCQAGAKNMLFVGYLHWHESTYYCGFKRQASILKDAFAVNSCGTSHADSLFVDPLIKKIFKYSVYLHRVLGKSVESLKRIREVDYTKAFAAKKN